MWCEKITGNLWKMINIPNREIISNGTWVSVTQDSFTLAVLNTLRLRRNGQHFADDTFKRIFFNENVWILIKISLTFDLNQWWLVYWRIYASLGLNELKTACETQVKDAWLLSQWNIKPLVVTCILWTMLHHEIFRQWPVSVSMWACYSTSQELCTW